jgi:drug/metabolite transporter (DMT)-like permease
MKGGRVMAKQNLMRGYICAGGGAVIWGITGTVGQYLLTHYHMDAYWITNMRMFFGGMVLLFLSLPHWKSMVGMLKDKNDFLHLLGYSLPGLLMSQLAFYICIFYSNSGTAAILCSLSVVMMAGISCVGGRRLPSLQEGLSLLLAVVGVFLLATNGDWSSMALSPAGLFWGLIAAVGVVFYSYMSQQLVWKWGSVPVNAVGMFMGGLCLTVFLQPWHEIPALDPFGFLLLAALVLIGTDLTYILFLRGVGDIGPIKATLFSTLEPVSSAMCSAFFLGTMFDIPELVGFVCILMTVFLVMAKFRVGG